MHMSPQGWPSGLAQFLRTFCCRGSTPTPQGSPFLIHFFYLGFKMMQNLASLLIFKMLTLVLISRLRMHLILLPLVLGHLNTTIYLVSFLLSVCCSYSNAYVGRSTRQIKLITSKTLRSHAGTNIFTRRGLTQKNNARALKQQSFR
jgi:hypothetical protein